MVQSKQLTMMHASKITIDYNPQKIKYFRDVDMPEGYMDIEDITIHLKEGEAFTFVEIEDGWSKKLVMQIMGHRFETEQEVAERVTKQEQYNKNCELHKAKYNGNK